MNIPFETSPAHAGYGARIWVNRNDLAQFPVTHRVLDKLSKWGGTDKTDGEMVAWEFGEFAYVEALRLVKRMVLVDTLA